jgi:hypothetical protein
VTFYIGITYFPNRVLGKNSYFVKDTAISQHNQDFRVVKSTDHEVSTCAVVIACALRMIHFQQIFNREYYLMISIVKIRDI